MCGQLKVQERTRVVFKEFNVKMFKTCGDIDDIKRLGQFLKLSLKKG